MPGFSSLCVCQFRGQYMTSSSQSRLNKSWRGLYDLWEYFPTWYRCERNPTSADPSNDPTIELVKIQISYQLNSYEESSLFGEKLLGRCFL
jgi:hypothetical protein